MHSVENKNLGEEKASFEADCIYSKLMCSTV